MKKIVCLIAVVLMIASVAFAAAQKKMMISEKDLPGMKGTWAGILGFGYSPTRELYTSPAKLEILNDTVPVKAKLTVQDLPQQVAQLVGLMSGQNVFETDEGVITTQGTLMFPSPEKYFFEVTLTGKGKINVWYIFKICKGEGDFTKK
jgi:hypothetical protein